jgi:cytochrome c peroxidase
MVTPQLPRLVRLATFAALIALLVACGGDSGGTAAEEEEDEPAEVVLGERLFLETRFAQSFAAGAGANVNAADPGDPVTDVTATLGEPLAGPFRGSSINCRACHLVDEQRGVPGGGVRTYADFARRSPIPARQDGRLVTPRNSPPLVNASLPHDDFLLHFDGEFPSAAALVRGTFTGRNFGWLPLEAAQAVAHIARVIREDDGHGALAQQFGALPYRVVFAGTTRTMPEEFRIPAEFRIDVAQASNDEVLDAVARLVSAYLESLQFATDAAGEFVGSPYDTFLRRNRLPRSPAAGESPLEYSRRLRDGVAALAAPSFIGPSNGHLALHPQEFRFGQTELRGLQIFLAESGSPGASGIGNCVVCHPAPLFTDFGFHNTGTSQLEYDEIHGAGAFGALVIPDLAERNAAPEQFLPPSPAHPTARGTFLAVPSAGQPGLTDLGAWNVLGNPGVPAAQTALQRRFCQQLGLTEPDCTAEVLLAHSVATFKTPGLRDLGQSAPYFHTGQAETIEAVIDHYIAVAALARPGGVRNGAPELAGIALASDDRAALAAFLRSLNEDYE